MKACLLAAPIAAIAGVLALVGMAAQDPTQQLKQVLKDTDVHPSWIYNDIAKGTAEAKKTGKPMLVVFR